MKTKMLRFTLLIFLILPCVFVLSACDDGVIDVANVQFISAETDNNVLYRNHLYSDVDSAQIYLVPSSSDSIDDYLLKITFSKHYGIEEINEEEVVCVGIEGWSNMEIRIKKAYYDSSKKVYLNGKDITSKAKPAPLSKEPEEGSNALGAFWYDGVYYFEDFGLVKGNSSEYINTIEYK